MTRQDFMDYFRSDDYNQQLSVDDCIEIFLNCLKGQSDITSMLLEQLCDNYDTSLSAVFTEGWE
jgi:hypothetical protein